MAPDTVDVGWAFPPRTRPNGAVAVSRGTERLAEAMRIILTTYPGERVMRPEFGSRLRDHVFADMGADGAGHLAQEVHAALTRWEPRVEIVDVLATAQVEPVGLFHITVSYRVRGAADVAELVFPFHTVPGEEAGTPAGEAGA